MIKTSILFIFSIFLCYLLSSCCDTEFPEDPYQEIIGNWETNLNRNYYTAGDKPLSSNAPLMYRPKDLPKTYYEFSKGKTYNEFNQKGELISYGTYTIENRRLTLHTGNKHFISYAIISFSQNNLWLRYSFDCGNYEGEKLMQIHEITLSKY